jgi:hypothetical protein
MRLFGMIISIRGKSRAYSEKISDFWLNLALNALFLGNSGRKGENWPKHQKAYFVTPLEQAWELALK